MPRAGRGADRPDGRTGGIAIVVGVDRILDMCRTALNVTGDVVAATILARVEGTNPESTPLPG